MYYLRHKNERGRTKTNWLDSRHTFSFADYNDPEHMGWSDLRVINDDIVAPGAGFDTHSHNNMEILSIVLSGALEHKDSLGTGSVIQSGDVQRMTAGAGIHHSEFNPSLSEPVHFLQIWIFPHKKNLDPGYEQKSFGSLKMTNKLCLIASNRGKEESLHINQDIYVYQTILEIQKTLEYKLDKKRKYWIQAAEGSVDLNGQKLEAGDGVAAADEEDTLVFTGISEKSNFLIFDLKK